MNFDITWTITAIIAVSSFMSPIFVALINNHYHAKMRKMELEHDEHLRQLELQQQLSIRQSDIYYSDKKSAFSEFIKSAGEYASKRFTPEDNAKLHSAFQNSFLFCNKENHYLLTMFINYSDIIFNQEITNEEYRTYIKKLSDVTEALKADLESSKPITNCKPSK